MNPVEELFRRVEAEAVKNRAKVNTDLAGVIVVRDLRFEIRKGESVAAAVIAEEVSPAAGTGGLTASVATHDDGAGTTEDKDTGIGRTEGGGEAGIKVVADENFGARPESEGKATKALTISFSSATGKAKRSARRLKLPEHGENLAVGGKFKVERAEDATATVAEDGGGFGPAGFDAEVERGCSSHGVTIAG